jgi:hypothetical protein
MKETEKQTAIKVGGVLLGAGLGYYFIVKPLLATLGVIKSPEDKQNDAWALSDVFDINYYKNLPAGAYLMKQAEVLDLVKRIWDATGFFNDDETAIYSALRQPRYKSQISQLNYTFLATKNKSLIDFLKEYLNESELTTCRQIVNDKPRGF